MTHHEVVRTDDGYHARLRATNGHIIMSSETYTRRRAAESAIAVAAEAFGIQMNRPPSPRIVHGITLGVYGMTPQGLTSAYAVRYVDERTSR